LLFPNARFITGRRQWQRACNPHARDKASYIPELLDLLENSARLHLIDETEYCELLGPDWRLHWSDGHTPGQLLPEIAMPGGPVVFPGDLIPGAPWVHLPITMGYDRFPEGLIEEKQALLGDLFSRDGRLVFTHDPQVAMGRVTRDEKGRYGLVEAVKTAHLLAN
jgi:glyoxylase-like metal-dependent hydrolase (beta-lactamase superfamily II)